jgi:protein phosphatase PTC7
MATTLSTARASASIARSLTFAPTHASQQLRRNISRSFNPKNSRGTDVRPIQTSVAEGASKSMPTNTAIPHISLHIAASSSGKGRKFRPELSTYEYVRSDPHSLGVQRGSTQEEKRKSRPDSGQDAYFVTRIGGQSDAAAFAIADGVGGWTEHGVDPADFSHGLCGYMAETALAWRSNERLGPKHLLNAGYKKTIEDPEIKAGGTTACVAVAEGDGRMRIANLGDSGFLLLRLGTVHHYSNPQTHAFNTPYQMSLTPPDILAQATVFGGMPLNDKPERADLADHMLRHGDVLVLATDGVWDNLNSHDILTSVSTIMRSTGAWVRPDEEGYAVSPVISELVDLQKAPGKHGLRISETVSAQKQVLPLATGTLQSVLAAAIVGEAKTASLNQKRDGPFAKEMQKNFPFDPWHGGKVDDISVLVIVAVDAASGGGETPSKKQEKLLKAKL